MTIVIPSLFKIPRIYQTILELSICPHVDEIILIDNTTNPIPFSVDKLKHICEGHNTYVNPAWNKGVQLSTSDKICFLNDDIWFDWNQLGKISEWITEDRGLLGMSPNNYNQPPFELKLTQIPPFYKSQKGERPLGFGCCFFIHKKNWIEIPEEMKIWAGDDWEFYTNPKPNYIIEGLNIQGQMSATSDDKSLEVELNPIKFNDMQVMKKLVMEGKIDNYLLHTIWMN
jgi:Glycosyl transferase family 2